jgi:hypothetical protein
MACLEPGRRRSCAQPVACTDRPVAGPGPCRTDFDAWALAAVAARLRRRQFTAERTQVAFAQTGKANMDEAYEREVHGADEALERADFEAAFRHLERAHVLAQRMTGRHAFVHCRMLLAGLQRGDLREVAGQVPRIVASILLSRLWVPRGNTGRARVSAIKPMPVPDDLRHLVP